MNSFLPRSMERVIIVESILIHTATELDQKLSATGMRKPAT